MTGKRERGVGVLTGLAMEARCLRGTGAVVACSGARPERARAEAERLIEEGASGLVSFGLAGGLDPALRPGALVLADGVVLPNGRRVAVDAAWRARLANALDCAHTGAIVGSERLLATPAAKQKLHKRSGAVAVDMESHIVAEAADAARLPFVVVRAIGDPAHRAIPPAALAFVQPEGGIRISTLREVLVRPWELPALARLGLETRAALRALRRAAPLLGGLG